MVRGPDRAARTGDRRQKRPHPKVRPDVVCKAKVIE
jgi:hypothetical protein